MIYCILDSCLTSVFLIAVLVFSFILPIGVFADAKPSIELTPIVADVPDFPPELVPVVGNPIIIKTYATNADGFGQPTVVVEVRDGQGATAFLDWKSRQVDSENKMEVWIYWTPEKTGVYQIRAFAITGFQNPRPLSGVQTTEIEVKQYSVEIPNIIQTDPNRIQGKFAVSHNGWLRSNSGDAHEYKMALDIFGNFVYDENSGIDFTTNGIILGLKEDSVLTVSGTDSRLLFSKDLKSLTYESSLDGRASGKIIGTLYFDTSAMVLDETVQLESSSNIVESEIDDQSYEGESLKGSLILVPDSQIHTIVLEGTDLQAPAKQAKITSVKKYSSNPDIELQIELDSSTVVFSAVNIGQSDATIDADRWVLIFGKNNSSESKDIQVGKMVLKQSERIELARLELATNQDDDIISTEKYEVSIRGTKWQEDFGDYDKAGNLEEYSLRAKVKFSFDTGHRTGILYNKNMSLRISGTSDEPFVANNSFGKTVEIFISNNSDGRISQNLSGINFEIHQEGSSSNEGFSGFIDNFGVECMYLEPGEKMRHTTIVVSDSYWPIGRNGLAGKADRLEGASGIYIITVVAYARTCTTDSGELVPGGTYAIIAAFEVK